MFSQLSWIPSSFQFKREYVNATYSANTLTVEIAYPTSQLYAVFPALVLPGVGTDPRLPTNLSARSSLQF